jgi:hypothetical protein
MPDTPFEPEELARYAEVTLGRCLDLRPGELVLLTYDPEHRPFAVALAEAAFRRGLQVDRFVNDPLVERAELDLADEALLGRLPPWRVARALARTEGGAAAVLVDGEGEPDARVTWRKSASSADTTAAPLPRPQRPGGGRDPGDRRRPDRWPGDQGRVSRAGEGRALVGSASRQARESLRGWPDPLHCSARTDSNIRSGAGDEGSRAGGTYSAVEVRYRPAG